MKNSQEAYMMEMRASRMVTIYMNQSNLNAIRVKDSEIRSPMRTIFETFTNESPKISFELCFQLGLFLIVYGIVVFVKVSLLLMAGSSS